MDVDGLASSWLSLPELAESIGEPFGKVRQLVRDGKLAAISRGESAAKQVPGEFVSLILPVGFHVVPAFSTVPPSLWPELIQILASTAGHAQSPSLALPPRFICNISLEGRV